MTTKKIGVGVIGTGMAAKPHALALNDLKDIIDVKAIFSRNKDKCNSFATLYNFKTANSIQEISENDEIDMVSIHSPFFAPDPEPTITTGIRAMTASALGLLK